MGKCYSDEIIRARYKCYATYGDKKDVNYCNAIYGLEGMDKFAICLIEDQKVFADACYFAKYRKNTAANALETIIDPTRYPYGCYYNDFGVKKDSYECKA